MKQILEKSKKIMTNKSTCKFIFVVLFLGVSHWLLMQLYIQLCVGTGIMGILTSFISLGSPICQFINFIQYELSKHYVTIWAATGISFVAWMMGVLG